MKLSRFTSVVACAAVAAFVATPLAAAVPTPLHAYEFDGDLLDSGTAGVAITSEGGTVGASLYEFDPQLPADGGDGNQGLTLSTPGLSDPGIYSIEMYLMYEEVRSISDHEWLKLIDFKDASVALGFYYEDMPFSTRFDPVPADPGIESLIKMAYTNPNPGPPSEAASANPVVTPGEWNHVVATRDAAGQFTAYVDGVEVLSYADTLEDAVFSGPDGIMRFLQNDSVDDSFGYYNVGKGAIDFLNIYDETLSAGDISVLAAAIVPEPCSVALLSGLTAFALSQGRTRRSL